VTVLPLSGVTVVDAGSETSAYCAKLLWDLGASVTLLESPKGHPLRRRMPFDSEHPDRSLVFDWYHSGSTIVTVSPDDEAQLAATARDADVVLITPGHAPWPVAGDRPSWVPDHAVMCSVTPYGRGGPYEGLRSTHLVSVAMSGGVHRHGPIEGPPVAPPANVHWNLAGTHAALAVVAALRVHDRVGGQEIDISAQETETILDYYFERFTYIGARPADRTVSVGIPPTGLWKCVDGVFEVSAHQVHHWDIFLELLGRPAELSEPALADAAVRRQLFDSLREMIQEMLAPQSAYDLFERAQALGLPASVMNTPAAFVADEQLAARESIVDREVHGRRVRVPASPLRANVRLSRDTPGEEPSDGEAGRVPGPSHEPIHDRPLPLGDVRVLSFGAFYAGNVAASYLSALGADVVKVESRSHPEVLRQPSYSFTGNATYEPSSTPVTPNYATLARGARNLAIEPKHPEGREVLRRLIANADVVVENFGTGTIEKWGFGFEEMRERNPRLVMLSMSGFGRTGPRGSYRAYASSISNFCGLTSIQAVQSQLSDAVIGVHGALAVVAAVDHARRLGRAIHIDMAQIETMASLLAPSLLDPLNNGVDTFPLWNHVPESQFSGVFRCLGIDGWVAVEATDADELKSLADLVEGDVSNSTGLREVVGSWCMQLTPHSAAQMLQRVGVPAGAVQADEEVVRDPQLRFRHFPLRLPHPDLGEIEYPGVLHRFSATPELVPLPADRFGGSSADVLRRWIGMDAHAIADLERDEVLTCCEGD
jgi:crotonobetainyl-CoA:carnitine CoA-transferase CaiB-like acyl-CoA transferase